jgi:hypothetical protein
MNSAMGIVAPTVKTPHGLSASAFTTTSASTASRITRIARIASSAMRRRANSIPPSPFGRAIFRCAASSKTESQNPAPRRPARRRSKSTARRADSRIAPPAPARRAAPARQSPRNDGRRRSTCSCGQNPCRRRGLRTAWRGGHRASTRARSTSSKTGSRWRRCKRAAMRR